LAQGFRGDCSDQAPQPACVPPMRSAAIWCW
jgi:hypothetical protein